MKKVFYSFIVFIAAITALAFLGPLIHIAITAAITFGAYHYFKKTDSTFVKVITVFIGVIAALATISNIPGFIPLLAVGAIYWVCKNWNDDSTISTTKKNDPFTNFEKQWNELNK